MENMPQPAHAVEAAPDAPVVADVAASEAAATPQGPQEYGIVPATVARVTEAAAVVSFGYKHEGQVPLAEFDVVEGKPQVKAGDAFEVLVEALGDSPEQIVLSKVKARLLRTWDAVAKTGKGGQIQGTVVAQVPGGYAVDVGMRGFLPSSQADVRRVGDPEALIGQTLTFTVSEFDKRRGNVVLSRRALLEKEQKARKAETMAKLVEGAVLPGVVKTLTEYGAFIDLGGVDGLLHVSEMSWGRVGHPRDFLKIGQAFDVKVVKIDPANGKIGLSLKQLQEDPWAHATEKYPLKSVVTAKVVGFAEFGAFVQLDSGLEGLVHVSEMAWTRVKHPSHVVKIGEEIKAVVLDVDVEGRRLRLGMRQLQKNPWESLHERYPIGSKLRRLVRGVTEFGLFLGVEEGIDGLVHVSELAWTPVKHPGDLYRVGEEVEAQVLDIDVENERLSLSIKALQQDPWQAMLAAHPIGSKLKGRVMRIADFGAFVEIAPGIEGLVHISELSTERVESVASVVKVGDEIEVKVLDVNARDRKVSLSVKALSEVAEADYREHMGDSGAKTTLGDVFGDKLKKK